MDGGVLPIGTIIWTAMGVALRANYNFGPRSESAVPRITCLSVGFFVGGSGVSEHVLQVQGFSGPQHQLGPVGDVHASLVP
jgi:hypothetical protein